MVYASFFIFELLLHYLLLRVSRKTGLLLAALLIKSYNVIMKSGTVFKG